MPDELQDPSGNTQAFRAFAQQNDPAEAGRTRLIVILTVGAVALFAVVAAFVLFLT